MKNILLIDDDVLFGETTQILLSKVFNIDFISNPEDGIEALNNKQYDCVIIDYNMQGLNGLQVVKYIREHPIINELPIILLTAYDELEIINIAMKAGVSLYVAKHDLQLSIREKFIQSVEKAIAMNYIHIAHNRIALTLKKELK